MTLLASFFVQGRPRTKGSLKVITPRGRKPILIEDHEHSKPWRKQIKTAIQVQVPAVVQPGHLPCVLPVNMNATFLFARVGPSAQSLSWPVLNAGENAHGDIDKLLRNLLDAMKDARLIADDSLVVGVWTAKQFAVHEPGVLVEVSLA